MQDLSAPRSRGASAVDSIIDRDIERVRQSVGTYTRSELATIMHCGVTYVRALEMLAGVELD